MKLSFLPVVVLTATVLAMSSRSTTAQFTCSISATDEDTCLSQTDGSSDHCVWCALSSFGFCVSEKQAESMEQNIPGVECDRYSPTPGDDDAAPDDDGNIAPTDDAIPDDFWMCLQDKTEKACLSQNCTWCDTKAGFGLCMTGPTADSAADSDWFECTRPGDDDKSSSSSSSSDSSSSEDTSQEEEGEVLMVKDEEEEEENEDTILTPYDPSCIAAFFTGDQTKESCVAAVDMEGGACEFCTLPGSSGAAGSSLCLTQEQAGIAIQLGITCEDDAQQLDLTVLNPYDPACELAFLQDPTKEACVAAVDQDGGACEYCTWQASNSDVTLCLTEEQAEIAEQIGVECEEQQIVVNVQDFLNDPYDTSCVLAYLEDQTEEGCKAAVDQDGRPCEWCDLQGMTNLCLNEDQADMAAQLGVTCEKTDTEEMDKEEEEQQQLRGGGGDEDYDSVVLTA